MNQRTLRQFAIFIGAFFLLWFALSRINFIGNEKIQKLSSENETLLGDLFLNELLISSPKIDSDSILALVISIKDHIIDANEFDTAKIELFIVSNEEVNAFALPGRTIVVHTGLIKYSKSPEELASVIAHELAHIEEDHVMKKLTKEIGIALLSAVIGNNNSEIIAEMLHIVTSSYYSRDLESEADAKAVEYLAKADIDPTVLANFLFRFSNDYLDLPKELEWVSSHPIAKERSAEILELASDYDVDAKPVMDSLAWNYIQAELADYNY